MLDITRKALVDIDRILHEAGWDSTDESGIENAVDDGKMQAALHGLGEQLRSVAVLAYMEGMPLEKIADMLGVPVGTVKTRLHDARVYLRDALLQPEHLEPRP